MITVLSLSPAVDKIYFIDNFSAGGLYRVGDCLQSAGGKGINVSRVLKILGTDVEVLGFKAGSTGQWLEKSLADLGAKTQFISVNGQSRTNNNIIDKVNCLETEILEEGPTIDGNAWEMFMENFKLAMGQSRLLVCSGGLPKGLGPDTYARLIAEADKFGVKTILDSSGEVLRLGIEAGPYLIKPNLRELNTYFNRDFESDKQIIEASKSIIKKGVKYIVVSMGAQGALLISEDKVYKAHPLSVEVQNTIGSGDSMVAGICNGIAKDIPIKEAFELGCACAASNTEHIGIGVIDINRVNFFKENIYIEEV